MTRRYYVPEEFSPSGEIILPADEAKHAATVMRARPGDIIELFDGRNRQAEARITSVSKREVRCEAGTFQQVSREPPIELTACVALPKGDRSRMLVEKLTELGVTRVVPLQCARSPWKIGPNAIEKLSRYVIEACKQSGRNRLMEIASPIDCAALFRTDADLPRCDHRLIAHPAGPSDLPAPGSFDSLAFAVGPEGGFTDEEVEQAVGAGWVQFSFGPRIYRIETAAIAFAARLLVG